MAGGGEEALEAQLTGLNKIFNSVTVRGRANVRYFHEIYYQQHLIINSIIM